MSKSGTRGLLILLSIFTLILSACETSGAPEVSSDADVQVLQDDILFNTRNSRSGAEFLDSAVVRERIFLFLADKRNVKRVGYRLNNADLSDTPFKIAGPDDTVTLTLGDSFPNRTHLISAEVTYHDGKTKVFTATFLKDSNKNLTDTLLVSRHNYRANSKRLDGQNVGKHDYIFVIPEEPVSRIEFYLDNDGSGTMFQRERYVFYDMAGTDTNGHAWPLSRKGPSEGEHTVTAVIHRRSGEVVKKTARFSVGSTPAPENAPAPTPSEPRPQGEYGPQKNPSIPNGAIYISPGQDIMAVMKNYPRGTTYVLQAGVHRGQNIILDDNDSLIGEYGAVLSGGKVVTSFAKSGDYWVLSNQTQQAPVSGLPCLKGYAGCKYAEQVFINNTPLEQVMSRSELNSGQFYFDYGANKIYLLDDPRGKTVEVSFTGGQGLVTRPNTTVRNLIIEKYNTKVDWQAVAIRDNSRFENNIVRFNGGVGLALTQGVTAKYNYVHHNVRAGVTSWTGHGIVFENNEVAYNNYKGHWWYHEGGGVKLMASRDLVVRNNHSHHNLGPGLWTDWDNINTLYENNVVTDNLGHGIFHEMSGKAIIRNNIIERNGIVGNGGRGISLSNSRNVKVYNNTLKDNTSSLFINNDCRSGADTRYAENNEVYNNTVYQKAHIGPNSEWGNGKAATWRVEPNCHLWPNSFDSWYTSKGIKFHSNTYHLSGTTSGSLPFFFWKGDEYSYNEWKAVGQN